MDTPVLADQRNLHSSALEGDEQKRDGSCVQREREREREIEAEKERESERGESRKSVLSERLVHDDD